MEELDMSGVDPLRYAEMRRRIAVINEFVAIEHTPKAVREAFAARLGIGEKQFMRLVATWRALGDKLLLAADCIGGGPKPWAGIVEAMLRGEIPFWLIDRGDNFRDILVRPGNLARFRRAPVELRKLPGGVCQDFCQEDAAEILNIKVSDFVRISKDIGLCPQMSGRRQASPRSDLLKVASCVAWPGEIAWRLGVKPQKIRGLMRDEGIAPISTGWDRKQLQKVGLLPT